MINQHNAQNPSQKKFVIYIFINYEWVNYKLNAFCLLIIVDY